MEVLSWAGDIVTVRDFVASIRVPLPPAPALRIVSRRTRKLRGARLFRTSVLIAR